MRIEIGGTHIAETTSDEAADAVLRLLDLGVVRKVSGIGATMLILIACSPTVTPPVVPPPVVQVPPPAAKPVPHKPPFPDCDKK